MKFDEIAACRFESWEFSANNFASVVKVKKAVHEVVHGP